jgi:hypothetical protein
MEKSDDHVFYFFRFMPFKKMQKMKISNVLFSKKNIEDGDWVQIRRLELFFIYNIRELKE